LVLVLFLALVFPELLLLCYRHQAYACSQNLAPINLDPLNLDPQNFDQHQPPSYAHLYQSVEEGGEKEKEVGIERGEGVQKEDPLEDEMTDDDECQVFAGRRFFDPSLK
jgi:hypothetical protein